jgi:hypothetical protein
MITRLFPTPAQQNSDEQETQLLENLGPKTIQLTAPLSLNSQPEARHCLTAQPTNNERETHTTQNLKHTPFPPKRSTPTKKKRLPGRPPRRGVADPLRNLILSPGLSPFPPSRHVGLLVGGKLNNHHTSQFPSCCSKHHATLSRFAQTFF